MENSYKLLLQNFVSKFITYSFCKFNLINTKILKFIMQKSCKLFLILLFFLSSPIVLSLKATKTNITTDETALLALKSSIISDPFQILARNWSRNSSVCSWVGITCGSRHHRVVKLNISDMGLTGHLPHQISNLTFLVSLDMRNNSFQGHLPDSFSNLRRLRILRLSFNSLSGRIPSWVGRLPKLQILRLRNNSLSEFIPPSIFNISTLKGIDLAYNNISGNLPKYMCHNTPNLRFISLPYNQINGELPSSLSNCSALQDLSLPANNFYGNIPKEIGNLKMLQHLYLAFNRFTGALPSSLGNHPNLVEFDIQHNHINGQIPSSIFNISSLEKLYLAYNTLSGSIPSEIGNLTILRELYGNYNLLTGEIPEEMGNLHQLEFLNLANNNLHGLIPSLANCMSLKLLDVSRNPFNATLTRFIGNLSTSLTDLYISDAKLKGNIPIEIGNLGNLQSLDLAQNDLTGYIPTTIGGMKNLQRLYLYENKLGGPFPNALCKLNNLGLLALAKNQISGSIPKCIGNVPSLREIYLAENLLSSNIPENLWNLIDVLHLDLSNNSITGNLGSEISSLRAITYLDFSNNLLSGDFSRGIGDLITLTYLSLSHNVINGSIPDIFDKLVSLEHLDLSSNNLSGTLPQSIEKLKFLKLFNVSSNQLGGKIPDGGPFHNFTYESFMSNKGFCGAPWLHFPSCPTNNKSGKKRILMYAFISLAVVALVLGFIFILIIRKFPAKKGRNQFDQPLEVDIRRISYLQLRRATSEFSEANLIGIGGFGSVYKATLPNGEVYALKVFHLQHEGAFKSFERECEVLGNIRHRNIVKVISSCSNLDFKSLILQYMPNGSLESWLYSNEFFLDFLQRLDLMIDVGCALEYLHHGYTTQVVHCDLKPSNVLIDFDMVGHVSDFGISRLLGDEESFLHTMTLATFGYMAPEYGTDGLVSTKCDVYSFGIMLLEVFTRKRPNDDMFNEGLSLRSWVSNSISSNLFEVIDRAIFQQDEEFLNKKLHAAYSIIELGLNCSEESKESRPNIMESLSTLRKIKLELI